MRFLTCFLILVIVPALAQENKAVISQVSDQISHNIPTNPNAFDNQGRKTGKWTILFDEYWNITDEPENASYYRLITYYEGKPKGMTEDYFRSGQIQMQGILISENPEIFDGDVFWYSEVGNINDYMFYRNGYMDYEESILRFGVIVEDQRKTGEKDQDYISLVNALAGLYYYQSKYSKAILLYQESLMMAKNLYGESHQGFVNIQYFLALSYRDLGQHEKSEPLFLTALAFFTNTLGERHPYSAGIMNNLALLYRKQGRYEEAVPLVNKSLDIRKEVFGVKNQDYAFSLNNLATLYFAQGFYTKAELLYIECSGILKEVLGERNIDYATSLNALALLYIWIDQSEKAEPLLLETMSIYKEVAGENSIYYATVLDLLGSFYREQGKYVKAEDLHQNALTIYEQSVGKLNPHYADCLNHLAELYTRQGQYVKAESLFKEALYIRKELLGERHPHHVLTLSRLATMYHMTGNNAQALPLFLATKNYYLDYLGNTFESMGERDREKFYQTLLTYFATFQNFAIEESLHSPEILGELYNLQLATKSVLLNTTNMVKKRILESNDRVLIDLYVEVQGLKQTIGQYQNLALAEIKINIDSLSDLLSEKDKQLSKYASFYAEETKLYTWLDVKEKLEKGEAAIEVIRFNKQDLQMSIPTDTVLYAALIVTAKTKENPTLVLFNDGNGLEEKNLHYYRNNIRLQKKDTISYYKYWTPLKKYLKGIKTIYFSPDGVFNSINLQTLYNPDKDEYLIEDVDIRIVTSTKDLMAVNPSKMPYNYAILIGNPDFGQASQPFDNRNVNVAITIDSLERNGISSLPGTKKEIAILSTLFQTNEWRQDIWTGQNATEEQLKKMRKPKVLHIATHGFFEPDNNKQTYLNNPLYRSGLLLSGAENIYQNDESKNSHLVNGKEDGVLTAFEAMNLNIQNTELVVLSACETGLGEIRNGEGVYGLQRAFQVAGARSLLISLWKVSDQVTQELMVDFYSNWLGGMSKREALMKTQLMLKEKYKSPFYWGAFILIGE